MAQRLHPPRHHDQSHGTTYPHAQTMGRGTHGWAMSCVHAGASPACPGVMTKDRGLQWPSAARWIFVVGPPRDQGMVVRLAGRGPF